MLNDFRTKLLNLSYNGEPSEHIPSDFVAAKLDHDMKDLYDVLFPRNSSRFHKMFLAHCYLNLIEAAGLTQYILSDSRVSYNLQEESDFFKIYRNSNAIISHSKFSINIMGYYKNNMVLNDFYDEIEVTQNGSASTVDIRSITRNEYYKQGQAVTFSVTPGYSNIIPIGSTGLSFQLYAGEAFGDTANKAWAFVAEAPYEFNFNTLYNRLKSNTDKIDRVLAKTSKREDKSFENLWKSHYNPVYKVAGLLIAYVDRLQ